MIDLSQVIEESGRLYMYTRWLDKKRNDPNAWVIANAALDIVLKDVTRTPKIRYLREIAVILPSLPDASQLQHLLKRIEAQEDLFKLYGTTEESVRLQMYVLLGKYKLYKEEAYKGLGVLFESINSINEVGTKVTCLAWMLNYLSRFENNDSEKEDSKKLLNLIEEVTTTLLCVIDDLLNLTANHFRNTKNAITALTRAYPELAYQLVTKLNTESSRDSGYQLLIDNLIRSKTYNKNTEIFLRAYSAINDEYEQERLLNYSLYWISQHCMNDKSANCNEKILELWKGLRTASPKIKAAVYTIKINCLTSRSDSNDKIKIELKTLWEEVVTGWLKIDIGYWIVLQLADIDKPLAEEWMGIVRKESLIIKTPTASLNHTLQSSIRLAIKVFSKISANKSDSEKALSRLAVLINTLSSLERRVILWTELAIKLHYSNQKDLSTQVVKTYIHPILNLPHNDNEYLAELLVSHAAPILYLSHASSFVSYLKRIKSNTEKDNACLETCRVLLRRVSNFESYYVSENAEYDVDPESVIDLITILKLIRTDTHIYEVITDLTNSLIAHKNKHNLTRTFVADQLEILDTIAQSQLPDQNNIKHKGFQCAALAQIYKAKRSISQKSNPNAWKALKENVDSITNIADRAIVVAVLNVCAGSKELTANTNWLSELKAQVMEIPSVEDRIERFKWIAQIVQPHNQPACRNLLTSAMQQSNKIDSSPDAGEIRQQILDYAHNIDPLLADNLIDLLDTDEARAPGKEFLKDRAKHLQKTKDVAENPSKVDLSKENHSQIAEISRRNLGLLNAHRINPIPTEEFQELADIAADMSMQDAYHVWSWILENQLIKKSKANKIGTLIPTFESICLTAELILALVGKSKNVSEDSAFSVDKILGPGSRFQLFDMIKEWAANQTGVIKISDPYFGPQELEVIKAIAEVNKNLRIQILTSKEHIRKKINGLPDEEFQLAWSRICDTPPPETEVFVLGIGNEGKHPIHDRWLISSISGLRLGSSAGSIGVLRISELSEMTPVLVSEAWNKAEEFIRKEIRALDNQKITLTAFSL